MLFRDFNEAYDTVITDDTGNDNDFEGQPELLQELRTMSTPGIFMRASPDIGAALAKRSLSLVRLSASYIAEASDFFAARDPAWVWDSLLSLSLTSYLMVPETAEDALHCLLIDAGLSALQMPRLKTMAVWYGTKGNACAFTYEANDHHTAIKWQGTRDLVFGAKVIDVWRQVALRNTRWELTVERRDVMSEASIKSHAVAIQRLGLAGRVVHPVSLRQIAKEAGK
ncbi:hypothetical protein G6O67_006663 [Ophiocordyceps sinensis]|uniref:DUF6546 domain-containing protein n=1 Tax=Ophiocordyceps sinensis TaxID=72228 RepID=A0A8H4LW08_9HYPO|nr:hypothetical protein G6O67_006663 [Ophiocordyceps sinensis]